MKNLVDSASEQSPTHKKWHVARACALVLFIAVFVRIYDMNKESIWWDEYTSVVHLHPPKSYEKSPRFDHWNNAMGRETAKSLFDFWKQNRVLDPATMPLYYTLEYGWNKYINRNATSIRFLSLSIALLILPVIYLLGRKLYGHMAGLIAALCVAMSPIHALFAIEIRMYCIFTLLALLSVYTFVNVVENPSKRWWTAHALANLFLFWTHPFSIFIPCVEGLFLLYANWKTKKRIVLWGILQILLLIPSGIYISTIQFWSQDSTDSWMKLPTLPEFLGDLIADDCIGLTYQLRATTKTWEVLFNPKIAQYIVSTRFTIGKLMALFFILTLSLFAVQRLWKRLRPHKTASTPPANKWTFFLFLWWVVPPILLYLISIVWRPCIMPRYTLHCSLALYLLLGGAIVSISWRPLRRFLFILLIAFYTYEQSLVLVGPQHTNWKAAAAHIRNNGSPDDLILVENDLWKQVFCFNMGPAYNLLSFAVRRDLLAEQGVFFLDFPMKQPAQAPMQQAWILIRTGYFGGGPDYQLEKELQIRNLSFDRYEFEGVLHVLLYRVYKGNLPLKSYLKPMDMEASRSFCELALEFWLRQKYESCIITAEKALEIEPESVATYNVIGMAYKELKQYDKAIAAFQKTISLEEGMFPWAGINLAELLTRSHRASEALPVIQQALQELPNDAWGHTVLGWVLMELKRYDEARSAFEKAIEFAPYDTRSKDGLREVENREKGLAPTPWS